MVNALLRKTNNIDPNQKDKNESLSAWYSYPAWIIDKWIHQFGEEKTIELCEYLNMPSHIDLRLNL